MTGTKKFLYTNQVNPVALSKFAELKLDVIIPMMQTDKKVWDYMVDKGDRKKPRWNRNFTLTILASLKPKFVQQMWDNAES